MIAVKINDHEHQFAEATPLSTAIASIKIEQKGIAIAINQNIITKSEWANTPLRDNDNILIIKATQGG